MDDVIGALQAMKERNSTNVNANSSLPFRQHLAPRGGHMNRPPPNYTTTRFYNINTGAGMVFFMMFSFSTALISCGI